MAAPRDRRHDHRRDHRPRAGGEIVARNDAVPSAPETVNQDAYAAWLFRIKPADPAAMDALLDARGYQAVIGD